MATITIKSGDTLSGIAKANGTTVDALMKANPSITDANKIYAGAALNLPTSPVSPPVAPVSSGSTQPAPVTPSSSVTDRVAQNSSAGTSAIPATSTLYGASVPSNTSLLEQYRSSLGLDSALKSMQDSESAYTTALQNLPKQADLYQQEQDKRGIGEMQTNLQSLDDRLASMEDAINSSEQDIRNRISAGGGVVTENQVERLVSSEKQPLIQQYQQLLEQRNQLADKLTSADNDAKTAAGLEYSDAMAPVTAAEKSLSLQKDQYGVLSDLLTQVLGASEKDADSIVAAAKDGTAQQKQDANDVISRAIQMAQLANETPAGVSYNIGGTTVTGNKSSSGGASDSDVESYALELLNNPNFSISDVPQSIRGAVLTKRDDIVNQAASTPSTTMDTSTPITAYDFGQGVNNTFTQTIPGIAKSAAGGIANFVKGLFGM